MGGQKRYKVAVLPGDGIGPEIMVEAIKVLRLFNSERVHFELVEGDFGAGAYFKHGHPFPQQTVDLCDSADIIVKGPIGLNLAQSQKIPIEMQAERGALLPLRKRYETFANYRPIYLPKSMTRFSPLKPAFIGDGIDILMVRELCGGLYFGTKMRGVNSEGLRYVEEQLEYSEDQIALVAHEAFKAALKRKKKLHHVHKANVLQSSVLWIEVVDEIAKQYPEVVVEHMLVDAVATHLCLRPTSFDVMLMENMFGDILSDQGGGLLGSLGLMPSACSGNKKIYYEPSHGSAPDIAGKGLANPYSMIGSIALMLDMSCQMPQRAAQIWNALEAVYAKGYTTADLRSEDSSEKVLSTSEFGSRVVQELQAVI